MKILVLTSVYKDLSLGNRDSSTNIVNSFANDWVKQGHEVIVIHNAHCYPKIIHLIPNVMKKKLASIMGFAIADYNAVSEKKYKDGDVTVYRLPFKKYIPHKSPSKRVINKQLNKIKRILDLDNYVPDVITGHWASPQMELIYNLKKIYNCKTALILHGTGYIKDNSFNAKKYLSQIDCLGCRSYWQAKDIKNILEMEKLPYICYSGVPDDFIKEYDINLKKFENIKKWKITFVGRLVAYKNVDTIIKVLSQIKEYDWELNIIGDGAERKKLINLAKQLNCLENINFLGKIPREQVMQILKDTHIFIMTSTNEIFGLVYLEAMLASCITIASKKGGIDGIINNSENGFLCKAGNVKELLATVNDIFKMDKKTLSEIVNKGYYTATNYSDSQVAHDYLKNITK